MAVFSELNQIGALLLASMILQSFVALVAIALVQRANARAFALATQTQTKPATTK